MAMTPKLRNSVIAAVGGGAIAIASALITGPTGNDGLEGVRYDPYRDVVASGRSAMATLAKTSCSARSTPRLNAVRFSVKT